jgi:NAD(P)-dependent dehydrogenase (short-subunit alcohol dehydrogenase family)
MPFGYEGKRVVVCGGGGAGMGAAVVRHLTDLGAEVHVLDLKEPPIDVASAHVVDLRDPDAITAAVEAIDGSIDSLFNCAGIGGPPHTDAEVVLVNFLAQRHVASLVAPRMPEGSAICGIASAAGSQWMQRIEQWLPLVSTETYADAKAWIERHPDEIASGYAPSKEALIIWTMWSAIDFAARGIRINVISPGTTTTPMTDAMKDVPGSDYYANLFATGLGRWATADEQAWPMIFLNSPLASYVHGEHILCDGGTTAGLLTGRLEFDFDPEHLGAKHE